MILLYPLYILLTEGFSINNIDLTVKVNDNTILTIPWAGNLMPDSSSNLTFPILNGLNPVKLKYKY